MNNFIKEFINITLFKNKKPIYSSNQYYTVGDRGIALKINFSYDYGIQNLIGKIMQIQYKLPENGLYIDEFMIENNGLTIERRIDDKCFYKPGNIEIQFALKDDFDNTYIQIPYSIIIEIKPSFISSNYLTAPVQELMVEGLIHKAIIYMQKFIDQNLDKTISDIVENKILSIDMKNNIEENIDLSNIENQITKIKKEIEEINNNNNKQVETKEIIEYDDSHIIQEIDKIKQDIEKIVFDFNNYKTSKEIKNPIFKNNDYIIYNYQVSDDIIDKEYIYENNNYIFNVDEHNSLIVNMNFIIEPKNINTELYHIILDIIKQEAYKSLYEKQKEIIELCSTIYFFGLNSNINLNQSLLKKWLYNQEEKIKKYSDITKKLIIEDYK